MPLGVVTPIAGAEPATKGELQRPAKYWINY
jgi:hypothetical protein